MTDAAEAIRAARTDSGLTIQQAADLLGVHWNTLHSWERGVHRCRDPHAVVSALGGEPIDVEVTRLRAQDRPPMACRARVDRGRYCYRRVLDRGLCEEHYWQSRWPLPAPQVPDEPRAGWQREAECRGMDTELFFPSQGDRVDWRVVRACASCPVRPDCLADDLQHPPPRDGVRGGLSAYRRNSRQERAA